MAAQAHVRHLDWQLRPAAAGDAGGIVHLLNRVFGDWGDRDYWRWKYAQPPAPFRTPSAVAELDGRIIGHFGIVPLQAVLEGKTVHAAQTVDAAVLPSHRRRGIHSALGRYVLGQAAQADVTWIYAFPGLFSLSVDQRIGYRAVAYLPEMVRLLQPRRACVRALRALPADLRALYRARQSGEWTPDSVQRLARLRRSLLWIASWASAPVFSGSPTSAAVEVLRHDMAHGFGAGFDALWAQVRPETQLGLVKDATYLTWRYAHNPRGPYVALVARERAGIAGLVILQTSGSSSAVAELLVLPGRDQVVASLLAAAARLAQAAGSLILTAWAPPRHPYHALLKSAGFVSQQRLHRLATRWATIARWFYQVVDHPQHLPPGARAQLASLAKTSSLSMGDSDLV
jgi:GNAT superfamily N-acetyltransferase